VRDQLGPESFQAFVQAARRYLRITVGIECVVTAIGEPMSPAQTIAVTIDLSGDARGLVTWVFPRRIALELVRRLMCDPDPPDEAAADGATELANILTGRASEVLETGGLHCEIGLPRIHVGALPGGHALRMTTVNGPIDIVMTMSTRTSRTTITP